MLKKYKYAFLMKMNMAIYFILYLYSLTLRITVENEETWMVYLKNGGKVLLCTWHQQFFAAIQHFKSYKSFRPSLMISKSQDGEIIARIAQKQGWHTVRGSSSRGGGKALKQMIEQLRQSGLAAHIVDGPKGPSGIIKDGVISLAHAAEAAVVPFYTTADRAWYFKSWDRFMLPKPFARVTIRFGQILYFPVENDKQTFESQRSHLEKIMLPGLITA